MPKPAIIGGALAAVAALAAIAITLAFALGAFDGGEDDDAGTSAAPERPVPEAAASDDATGGDTLDEDAPPPDVTPMIIGDGSAGGFMYLEPVPLVPGRYTSPLASPEAWDRGMAAHEAERDKPHFEGAVNGFRLWSYDHAFVDSSVMKVLCGGQDFVEWRIVEKLEFTYLPPGTAAEAPQQEAMCPDGSAGSTGQNLDIRDGPGLVIWYESGERAFPIAAPAERVSAGEVQGRPAVIVRPLTEEGFDQSWVAFATDNGFIGIHAINLLLEETLKIAEGIRCEGC